MTRPHGTTDKTLDGVKITLRRSERESNNNNNGDDDNNKKKARPCRVGTPAGVAGQRSWEAITGPFKYRFSEITSR